MTWEEVKVAHPVGDPITGRIVRIEVYGVWIEFDFEFAGLMLIPDSGIEQGKMLADVFQVGESITATVIWHNDKDQVVRLTRRV
jgi:ribosomal protein S1